MKFSPRILKENVNISKVCCLREFVILSLGVLGVLLVVYIVLGISLDILVERIPVKFEKRLGFFLSKTYDFKRPPSPLERGLQKHLDDLVQYMPNSHHHFVLHIIDKQEVNAVALAGGHIVVFSGLLNQVESENELTMVLAHELGHFVHRDHLRGLGRGLVLIFLSSALFGVDSTVTRFVMKMLITTDLRFSRQQEIAADKFALDLLYKKYRHVGGSTDFFERIKARKKTLGFFKIFYTHPYSFDRVKVLKEQIIRKGYPIKDTIPLDKTYK